jgi:phosphoglycerate dehydrogenase-like enzyme
MLEKAKNLKVIGRAGIGVDNVDITAATARGIIVMNTPFGNSITTAEHAITLMLALARQIPEADLSTRAGKWEKNRFMGVEIFGKTLGVIGCGNIGSIVADRGRPQMKVIAFDPFLAGAGGRSRRRESQTRGSFQACRFYYAAHAAHREDQEHRRREVACEHEEGCAHHHRARRLGR